MHFRLPRRSRRDQLAAPASLADARHAVVSRAAAGLPVARISAETGHSPDVVRNVISTWANDEAVRQPVPRMPAKERRAPREPLTAQERANRWLRAAGVAVGLLAAGAAAVSYQAQLQLVQHTKHTQLAYVQAAVPDLGALVFALMGVSLALQGKRAVRARALNAVCVGLSVGMNALAAKPGWHDLSIWVMAPSVYAVASDSLIWIIRLTTVSRNRGRTEDEGASLLEMAGAVLLWVLRLIVAPPSTVKAFVAWVKTTPAAPPKRTVQKSWAIDEPPHVDVIPPPVKPVKVIPPAGNGRRHSKTSQFLSQVVDAHGDLAQIELSRVAGIVSEIAPGIPLDRGAASAALSKAIKASKQNGVA